MPLLPTAVQAVADVHQTLSRIVPAGVGRIVQFAPSQASASGPPTPPPIGVCQPTAMHAVTDGHETASNSLFPAPLGFGVGSITQSVPSHCSAIVVSSTPGAVLP
jgi:hypothetical protein